MFVFKYTDDGDPQLCMEASFPTQGEADQWHDVTAANYPAWTVEAVREEAADYEVVQVRYGSPVKAQQV